MTEAQHQGNVIKWSQQPIIRKKYPELKLLFHIPNGGRRDPIEAKHLKQQGVKRGVPDLFLPVAKGKYHGLFIEMKTETGRTSDYQDWWLCELKNESYYCKVCYGWKNAVELIEDYLNEKLFDV